MNKIHRDKFFGLSTDEHISQSVDELKRDAVGLWQIVSFGRQGFEMQGEELVVYVRRHLKALVEAGAKPVSGSHDGSRTWVELPYAGAADQQIETIIAEWLNSGVDPDAGGIWFALPHVFDDVTVTPLRPMWPSQLS